MIEIVNTQDALMTFKIHVITKGLVAIVATFLFSTRLLFMLKALQVGNETPLLTFPLMVIFPTSLIFVLLLMSPTQTREGILMRFGSILHLLLIISLPQFALYLALGFPFVFLCVELFETRLPKRLTQSLSNLVIA